MTDRERAEAWVAKQFDKIDRLVNPPSYGDYIRILSDMSWTELLEWWTEQAVKHGR